MINKLIHLVILLITTSFIQNVFAEVLIVNSIADTEISGDGKCTLREAINNANTDSDTTEGDCVSGNGNDIIDLTALAGTINLSSQLLISDNIYSLTIKGPGANVLALDGSGGNFRILHISKVTVRVEGLEITNGNPVGIMFGGGIANSGNLTLIDSIVSKSSASSGGGIYNSRIFGLGTLIIINSTISENSARYGGGIDNRGDLTIINSTVSGNSAYYGYGGGIFNGTDLSSTLTLINSTVSENAARAPRGGGIYNDRSTLILQNTIIANSINGDCFNSGVISNSFYNLIEDGRCNPTYSGDPKLGTLQNNGGTTPTHALLRGSPAIDAGDDTVCAAEPVYGLDQRGKHRTGIQAGNHCDIGAFELTSDLIELIDFTATPNGKNILFKWETGVERHSAGFYLWQAEPLEGSCKQFANETQLTNKAIHSQGDENGGAYYEYRYEGQVNASNSCYGLEERETSGKRNFYIIGPGIEKWKTFSIE